MRARYDAELPPFISIVRYPGRPIISVPELCRPPRPRGGGGGGGQNDPCSRSRSTILTEMFTRQIPQKLKSATVKITGIQKNPQYFLVGHSDGRLGKQVTAFKRHTKTLVGKLPKLPIQKSEEFEVGTGRNYRHPKESPIFSWWTFRPRQTNI